MTRTMENLLTWAPLGAGVALMLSDHKRWGLAVAGISPVTVTIQHPRGVRRALASVPRGLKSACASAGKALAQAGSEAGKSAARSSKQAAKGFRWIAS